MSNWKDISTAPVSLGVGLYQRILLWVADGGSGGRGIHAFGYVFSDDDGRTRRPVAEGYNGNWDIRFWCHLPDPPDLHSLPPEDKRDG